MKIFVLGTSNSVMTDGYVKALKAKHEVVNFSLGRVPCIYHIKVILERRIEIENCDLLIVDHYINDINRYFKRFGERHFNYCEDLYVVLSSLNVNILNILFPIRNIEKNISNHLYKRIISISNFFNIELIDLNIKYIDEVTFKDKLHLRVDLSFNFGTWLGDKLNNINWKKPMNGSLVETSYFSIRANDLRYFSENKVEDYENSLISINYLELKKNISFSFDKSCQLIAIGYFKDLNDCDGLIINEEEIILSRDGYLIELLDKNIDISSKINIEPLIASGSFYALGHKEKVTGDFFGAKIVDLIFKIEGKTKAIAAVRERIGLQFT